MAAHRRRPDPAFHSGPASHSGPAPHQGSAHPDLAFDPDPDLDVERRFGAGASRPRAARVTRRFLVFDADGELVATFASWDSAHVWSHLRAAEPLTLLPVRIEDQLERRTWTVDADQCRMTVWRRHAEYRVCLPEQALAPARVHVL